MKSDRPFSYFSHMFTTEKMRQIFSDEYRTQLWMDIEVALANAEEKAGVIPKGMADLIKKSAKVENIDFDSMGAGFEQAGFPVIPFVKEFMKICDPDAAKWIHYGATSQDIQDTGHALQIREALILLEGDLTTVMKLCQPLVINHRNTVMAGRSFQQHAAPLTFGFKVAVWLEEMMRHYQRLQELRPRVLLAQCSGAVGTLATLGDQGQRVRSAFAEHLGLGLSSVPWHPSRDGLAEALNWLALSSATLAKIANEIAILMRTEIDELREPFQKGRGGSSTMPQKRNPVICEPIIAAAHRLRELASSQQVAMIQEHERGVGQMHLEWLVLPEAFNLAAVAFSNMIKLLDGLFVNEEKMLENLEQGGGYIMAEAVMMALAPETGRMQAHEMVAAAVTRGRQEGLSLRSSLLADDKLAEYLTEDKLDEWLKPINYTGSLQSMVDDVLMNLEKLLGE